MGTWVILEYELQGRKLQNCKSQALPKYGVFKQICMVCHYLGWCCRVKTRLLFPGKLCLCSCVPLLWQSCSSWSLPGCLGAWEVLSSGFWLGSCALWVCPHGTSSPFCSLAPRLGLWEFQPLTKKTNSSSLLKPLMKKVGQK